MQGKTKQKKKHLAMYKVLSRPSRPSLKMVREKIFLIGAWMKKDISKKTSVNRAVNCGLMHI